MGYNFITKVKTSFHIIRSYFFLFSACSNETVIPEVRLNDVLSERLIRQVWNDIRAKLSEDGEFRGMKIDPLDIGDIHQNQKCKNSS